MREQLAVERATERPAQLARVLSVVRDAGHDVAAAEALGILEGAHGETFAGLEIQSLLGFVHVTDGFPMTTTGKVRKIELRERSLDILAMQAGTSTRS